MLLSLTLQMIVFRAVAFLLLAVVHGVALTVASALLGDPGPRHDGRLSPMPARHLEPLGMAAVLLFGLGWIRPVEFDPRELRGGLAGAVVVVLAGFAALAVAAWALHLLIAPALGALSYSTGLTASAFLREAGNLALWCALLSLVPVPPLAAGRLLSVIGLRPGPGVQAGLGLALLVMAGAGGLTALGAPAHAWLSALLLRG